MPTCPSCASEVQESSRFCPACGAALDGISVAPTMTSMKGRLTSSDSLDDGRFIPGTILAGRYRIIGLLGKGGMGEVYRADDLKLGQPVALKFLPEALARDAVRLGRFLNEVKIARQVSHPNVCRVYDVGEIEGQHYLSMEFVDGEDLASLLRRIGRLPTDKAVEVARQICAGVAAAHDRGVLHRDLKPANVMIDGRGKVRLTDFGLAGLAVDFKGGDIRAGTPAYMSPEQIEGREVTVKSDIYALGLVLYEMFTGKHIFKADTLAEMARKRNEATPASLSSQVKDLDPAVERVIFRCLEKDPRQRPSSAIAVAAALPGGDPLAAALAAGETPSPEMVAAAGDVGGLKPAVAWALLGSALLLLIAVTLLLGRIDLLEYVSLEKHPEILSERAREVIRKLGHTDPAEGRAHGFLPDDPYLSWIEKSDPSPSRWKALASDRPAGINFWYRESPRPLVGRLGLCVVEQGEPPANLPGMVSVTLDPRGRLVGYSEVPPGSDGPGSTPASQPDWSILFQEAGLDMKDFQPVEPARTPPVFSDVRAAWQGSFPERPETKMHVEAGGWHGRINYVEFVGPWSKVRGEVEVKATGEKVGEFIQILLNLVPLVAAIFLARRNLKAGRGDRSGAFRIGVSFLLVHLVVWAMMANHTVDFREEWQMLQTTAGWSLYFAVTLWLLYLALEPYVRRRWPDALISWSRLLNGRLRDPLVGRDILIGSLSGLTLTLLVVTGILAPTWTGSPQVKPGMGDEDWLRGLKEMIGGAGDTIVHSIAFTMGILFTFFLLRVLLRRQWLAATAFVGIISLQAVLTSDHPAIDAVLVPIAVSLVTFVMLRFGLLALTAGLTVFRLVWDLPLPSNLSGWYAGQASLVLLFVIGMALYGFYTSLAGRPMFGGNLLEE